MKNKAQAGLEYLMTYGWSIIIVGTLISALVLIMSVPNTEDQFSISDPTSFILKGATTLGHQVKIKLQNITGGQIEIRSISGSGYDNCSANGYLDAEGLKIGPGGEIEIVCRVIGGGSASISMDYTDQFGIDKTLDIKGMDDGSGETWLTTEAGLCDDDIDNDWDIYIDCLDEDCDGNPGPGGTCEYGQELTCDDGFDNDTDTLPDCDDPDCLISDSSLISYWPMDEITPGGGPVDIKSGNNGNLAGQGSLPSQTDAGKIGKGFEFDAPWYLEGIQIQNTGNLGFNENADYTYTGWFKSYDIVMQQPIFSHQCGAPVWGDLGQPLGGLGIVLDDRRLKLLEPYDGSFEGQSFVLSSNTWYHFAVVYDGHVEQGGSYGGNVSIYINGAYQGSKWSDSWQSQDSEGVSIGFDHDNDCYLPGVFGRGADFYGIIDEVWVFNRALSNGEISQLYQEGSLCP